MTFKPLTPLKIQSKLAGNPDQAPSFAVTIKDATGSEKTLADPRATRALVALMNQHAVIGGAAAHWGGPAAMAEMMSAIHAHMFEEGPWHQKYNFVNDAGHTENGIYALHANYNMAGVTFESLKKFRSIESKLTGHGEAHLNPEGVLISNGPLGSGLPQAQGLAVADALSGTERTTICTISDGASMEGEAKEAMSAIPGLAARGVLAPFVMIISDNDTKLSGRISKDSFSMSPTFESLKTLGWDLRLVKDGHNLEALYQEIGKALTDAKANKSRPIALLVKTIKGKGVKSTEESASGGHGYPLKPYDSALPSFLEEIYAGAEVPSVFKSWAESILVSKPAAKEKSSEAIPTGKVQPGFSNAAIKAASEGLPVFSVSSDLQGSTGIAGFHKEFPSHYLDIGVAEANMISTAVGLSKAGFIPIVDTFAQFGITKGNLPLIMSGLSEAPVIALFSHIGFQDAADGASHQSLTYLAATNAIPHTRVVMCATEQEAQELLYTAIKDFAAKREKGETPDSTLFFFGRENFPKYFEDKSVAKWEKAQVLKKGEDITLISAGPTLFKALEAAEALGKEGVRATVINHPFINRVDTQTVAQSVEATKGRVITVEDHQVIGGLGSMVAHTLATTGVPMKMKSLGVHGEFGRSAYAADHLYSLHQMNAEAIIAAAKELLG